MCGVRGRPGAVPAAGSLPAGEAQHNVGLLPVAVQKDCAARRRRSGAAVS